MSKLFLKVSDVISAYGHIEDEKGSFETEVVSLVSCSLEGTRRFERDPRRMLKLSKSTEKFFLFFLLFFFL